MRAGAWRPIAGVLDPCALANQKMQWISAWTTEVTNAPQVTSGDDICPGNPTAPDLPPPRPVVDKTCEADAPKGHSSTSVVAAPQAPPRGDRDGRVFFLKREGPITDEERRALERQYKLGRERRQKRSCLVIDPRRSKAIGYWDAVAGFALLFTATVTPFEVGFMHTYMQHTCIRAYILCIQASIHTGT